MESEKSLKYNEIKGWYKLIYNAYKDIEVIVNINFITYKTCNHWPYTIHFVEIYPLKEISNTNNFRISKKEFDTLQSINDREIKKFKAKYL